MRAPISLGIGPAEEFKVAVQLVRDMSVNRAICNQKYSPSEKIKNDKMGPNVKSQNIRIEKIENIMRNISPQVLCAK